MTDIAIIGMGCRFGQAPSLSAYWQLLRNGRDAFSAIPADRWDAEAFRATSSRDPDRSNAPRGAFLGDIHTFPALALGIPPRRVEVMDPQQRFTLETALEAIEDAGYQPHDLSSQTGVYVGITGHEFRLLHASRTLALMMASGQFGDAPADPQGLANAVNRVLPARPFSAPGVLGNMPASIVTQEFDLHGPSFTVDAACASAMVAIADAVDALRAGRIDTALAGGAYIQLEPEHYIAFSRIGAMSPSGHCRPFDARADGFVQGDGVGMLLLKRLEDAERDGDRVYAVISGIATNNDGRGDGPMAPRQSGQEAVLRAAWADAGLDPAHASHIEAHGTGTSVGDAIELAAIEAVFKDAPSLWIGSSKANIGHTMSAAGVAGVIKMALSLHHGVIPPLAGFEAPKDGIGIDQHHLKIPTVPEPWQGRERVAGVSSFGFGGTNGHAVLRAVSPKARKVRTEPELVLLSAGSESALSAYAAQIAQSMRDEDALSVASVARSLAHRKPLTSRAAIVASSRESLIEALESLASGHADPTTTRTGTAAEEPLRIAMLFPGQGAQRVGMLAGLSQRFPIVKHTLARLEKALNDELDTPLTTLMWPQSDLDPEEAQARLTATEHCQPAMYASGVALAALLAQVGVTPTVVTGHSLGEFTAAAVAGVASETELARYVTKRGLAMAAITGEPGAMAAVMADAQTTEGLLVPGCVLANLNHPKQTVVSGTRQAVASVVERATAAGLEAKALDVSHAFHSPVMAGLDQEGLLKGLKLKAPHIPVASGIAEHATLTAADAHDVFARHATSPVDFVRALAQCADAGANLYLQVGQGGPLASFARGGAPKPHHGVLSLAPRDDDDGTGLLLGLGQLYCMGLTLDVRPITAKAPLATLPPTPLPRERYWVVADKPTRALQLGDAPAPVRASRTPEVTETVEPTSPPSSSEGDVLSAVIEIVAKVSAYPKSSLRPTMRLVDDLGFDSLMVNDLATGLSERFPGIGGIPQTLLMKGPTVQDIADFVATGGSATPPSTDDDAPLFAFTRSWTDAPWPALPALHRREGLWAVIGEDDQEATYIAAELVDQGLNARVLLPSTLASADPAVLVWVSSLQKRAPGALSAGSPARTLTDALRRLAAAGQTPDVLALAREDDVQAEAIGGLIRTLSREWPDAITKHVVSNRPEAVVAALRKERESADQSVDVRLEFLCDASLHRAIPALDKRPLTAVSTGFSDRDTVLVSGGTRGIGLAVGLRAASLGARVILCARSAPSADDAAAIAAFSQISVLKLDVTDATAVSSALRAFKPTVLIHAAGVLADHDIASTTDEDLAATRAVKVMGWQHLWSATHPSLRAAVALSSFAGRFGNRHQAAYAAANAELSAVIAALPAEVHAIALETGPWVGTNMAQTIPAPVQAQMRANGVDFVGMQAGLDAIEALIASDASGALILARMPPARLRRLLVPIALSRESAPFLLDHQLDGHPVLPLAAVADLLAYGAHVAYPIEVRDLQLFAGVLVDKPVRLDVIATADRVKLVSSAGRLHDEARVRSLKAPLPEPSPDAPTPDPSPLTLDAFYGGLTFHGPLLRGIERIEGVGTNGVSGILTAGDPQRWMPGTHRKQFSVDPLALDSALQLAALVSYARHGRAGTPVAFGRILATRPTIPGEKLHANIRFGEVEGDRFTSEIVLRDAQGQLVLWASDVVAELQASKAETPALERKSSDIGTWPEVLAIEARLAEVAARGLQDPYFHVHEGTARDTTTVEGRELIHFSGYNYLGYSGDPRVVQAVHEAVTRYGTSVSASRVASGERPFHRQLEHELATAQGADDALLYTAGHATNVSTIGHILTPDDLVLHDAYIHDSALQGIKLSGAARRGYRHEDLDHLEAQLKALRSHHRRCLIIAEGVYSMDGDVTNLPRLIEIKRRYDAILMVDEAHSFGVLGQHGFGVGEHYGIEKPDVDIWMGTLSKSLSSCGGWVAGSARLIKFLRYTSPGFVYSAGLTPANGVAALTAIRLMRQEPERIAKLHANAKHFHDECVKNGLDVGPARGESGVIPIITGNSMHAVALSAKLLEIGINVQPIVYPAVPDEAARLRFFLSSLHSQEQLTYTALTVARVLGAIRAADRSS